MRGMHISPLLDGKNQKFVEVAVEHLYHYLYLYTVRICLRLSIDISLGLKEALTLLSLR